MSTIRGAGETDNVNVSQLIDINIGNCREMCILFVANLGFKFWLLAKFELEFKL